MNEETEDRDAKKRERQSGKAREEDKQREGDMGKIGVGGQI